MKIAGCWNHKVVGDNKCDGVANNAACDYDGGDCCLAIIDYKKCVGDDCICHESGLIHPVYVCKFSLKIHLLFNQSLSCYRVRREGSWR